MGAGVTAELRFLLGRAGTGKTHACLEAIRRDLVERGPDGPPLLFLTPEQATFQMERALLEDASVGATGRAQVLSFQRLAARVLQRTGGGAKPRLGELGKRMLLRALVQRHGRELKLFGRAARRPGFIDRLAGALSELRQYNVRPEDLARRLEQAEDGSPLAAKMHDLHLLYERFAADVDERFTDPDELLNVVAAALPASGFATGARLWIDGFAGFTPQEFVVLRALWNVAEEVNIALCLDPRVVPPGERGRSSSGDGPGPGDLFTPTAETYERLREFAREDRVRVLEPVLFTARRPPRFASERLRHVERELFRRPGRPYNAREEASGDAGAAGPSLRLVAAAGPRTEVEVAAREILRLVRERGWRFRDMAVIVHDLAPYEDLIKSVFNDLDIPCFIDSRRRLTHHPLTELIRSLLEAYAGGWPAEAVLRCLKTDFFPVTRDEVDKLENYALEHGIQGRGWTDDKGWRFVREFTLGPEATRPGPGDEKRLDELNDIRDRAVGPLRHMARAFAKAKNARDFAAALWDGLERLGVAATLESWIEVAQQAGRVDEAQEHERAWDGVVQLLDELVNALGTVGMTGPEFRQIVEAGLESLTVGMVPAGLDQVMVGTVERSRQPDIKAAFVLGAADRSFPPPPGEDVIFTDAERKKLTRMELRLSPTSREESVRQQYFLYILLTRASEFLWVSYPVADGQGKEQAPAATFRRLQQLFPGEDVISEEIEPEDDGSLLARIASVDDLVGTLALRLRRHRAGRPASRRWWELYDYVARRKDLRERALPLFEALDYDNATPPLPDGLARQLFGTPLATSVSRLETFAACPFRHFAQHGLRLRERETWQLDAAAKGTFLHAALRLFVEKLADRGLDWGALSDEEARAVADEAVDELTPNLAGEILLSSARHAFLAATLRNRVQRAVWALTEHARRGRFRPVAVEASFGRSRALWSGLVLDLGDGDEMRLAGQIDRVDAAQDEAGRTWVRVIDYKSSARSLPPGRVGLGLALQLPLYMAVVQQAAARGEKGDVVDAHGLWSGEPVLPAALLYFPVRDPFLRVDEPVDEAEWEALVRNALRMEGMFVDEVPVLRLMDEGLAEGSRLIKIRVTKAGSVYKGSSAAPPERLERLLRHAEQTAVALGRDILSGRIEAAPYRIGNERACTYCPLKAVCRFDPMVEGNGYRRLEVPAGEEAWRLIEEATSV